MTNTYLPDDQWNALRDGIALRGLTVPDRTDELSLEIARTEIDELLCAHGVMPVSIQHDLPPAGYFMMNEAAFEVTA